MEDQDIEALFAALSQVKNIEERDAVLEQYNTTLDEVKNNYLFNELPDEQYDLLWETTGGKGEGTDSSLLDMNSDSFKPDYTATAEYEGGGLTSEMLPGDSAVADTVTWLAEKAGVSPEAAMVAAGVVSRNPKQVKKGAEGMLTPKPKFKLKASKKDKPAEVVTPKQTKPTKPAEAVKLKKKDPAEVAMQKQLGKVIGTTGIATAIGLSGNRNKDGDFVEVPVTEPEVDLNEIARNDHSVGEENPWVTNQRGYHKRPGQNFWTVDDSDPYWDTHEMGTGSAFEDSVPKKEVKELDLTAFSHWFN